MGGGGHIHTEVTVRRAGRARPLCVCTAALRVWLCASLCLFVRLPALVRLRVRAWSVCPRVSVCLVLLRMCACACACLPVCVCVPASVCHCVSVCLCESVFSVLLLMCPCLGVYVCVLLR